MIAERVDAIKATPIRYNKIQKDNSAVNPSYCMCSLKYHVLGHFMAF